MFPDLAHSHPAVACALYAALWAAVSAVILWPFSRERFLDRLPIILTVAYWISVWFIGHAFVS